MTEKDGVSLNEFLRRWGSSGGIVATLVAVLSIGSCATQTLTDIKLNDAEVASQIARLDEDIGRVDVARGALGEDVDALGARSYAFELTVGELRARLGSLYEVVQAARGDLDEQSVALNEISRQLAVLNSRMPSRSALLAADEIDRSGAP